MTRDAIPEDERVTLISSEGQEFVLSIKSARKSGFIRSMLGEGPSSKSKGDAQGKSNKGQASSSSNGNTASDAAAQKAAAMSALGTPPPEGEEAAAGETSAAADPEGYVNPFAADSGADGQGDDGDDDDRGLETGFAEAKSNTVRLTSIRAPVLEKVIEYLEWNAKYSDAPKDVDIPPFEPRIPPDLALELLIAADYLEA